MLKYTVAKLDEVPEALRGEYEAQSDGTFRLKIDDVVPKARVDEFRNTNVELRKKLESFSEALGITNADDLKKALGTRTWKEIDAIIKKHETSEAEKLTAAGEWDKLKQQMVEQHARELEAARKEAARLERAVNRLVVEQRGTEAIAKANGTVSVLKPHVLGAVRAKRVETGDELDFVTEVVDSKGGVRLKDGAGTPMTVDDLVAELRSNDEFKGAFRGTGASGSGASGSGSGTGAGGGGPIDSNLPPVERVKAMRRQQGAQK